MTRDFLPAITVSSRPYSSIRAAHALSTALRSSACASTGSAAGGRVCASRGIHPGPPGKSWHRSAPANCVRPRRFRKPDFSPSTNITSRRLRNGAFSTAPPIPWRAATSVRRSILRPSRRFTRSLSSVRSRATSSRDGRFRHCRRRRSTGRLQQLSRADRALPRSQPGGVEGESRVYRQRNGKPSGRVWIWLEGHDRGAGLHRSRLPSCRWSRNSCAAAPRDRA